MMTRSTILEGLAAKCVARPRTTLTLASLLVLAALVFAASNLGLATSNLDLIDPDLPEVARFRAFAETFGTPNVLVAVLEANDPANLRAAVDRIAPPLRQVAGVRAVIDKLPFDRDGLEILGRDPYWTSYDGGMAFLFIQPDDPTSSAETLAPFVDGVRQALAAARLENLGVRAGLTGMPAYALDDKNIIQRDINRLSLLASGLVLILFTTAFGALRRPLLVVVALLFAVAFMLGVIAAFPGYLTLLSAFFASILFGLGIDYGIHLVDRFEELTAAGLPPDLAIPRAVGASGPPLVTGALTSAAVLLAMAVSGFRGFAELGIIAGIGLLVCFLAMVTLLPALLAWIGPGPVRAQERRGVWIGAVLRALQASPVAWLVALLIAAAAWVGGPPFDTDYLNLQPIDSETVRLERAMVAESDFSPSFAVFVADSLDRVKELVWALVNEDVVASVRSIRDFQAIPGMGGTAPSLPAAFRAALASDDGHYAVYAYPADDVWDDGRQLEFIARMRAIDPEVTGMPFLGRFMVERSQRALRITCALGILLLLVIVLADFRRPLPAFLAVLPAILTAAALHGLMRWAGVTFNPLNIMALPVVLGIAVDDGVHMVHRFLAEGGDMARTLAGTGRAVVLTSATTIAAFGSLAFTAHRGLASFAIALSLGVLAALLLSVALLPRLLLAFRARLINQKQR
jgi:predicted RND superfamily exporter protein